jgi:hypothetical protein
MQGGRGSVPVSRREKMGFSQRETCHIAHPCGCLGVRFMRLIFVVLQAKQHSALNFQLTEIMAKRRKTFHGQEPVMFTFFEWKTMCRHAAVLLARNRNFTPSSCVAASPPRSCSHSLFSKTYFVRGISVKISGRCFAGSGRKPT